MTRARRPTPSDREYFARGMEGESGVCAVENSLFYNDLSVIFYTPLYFNGRGGWRHLRCVSGRFHGEVPAHLYFQRADQHLLARSQRRRYGPLVHHLYQRGEKRRRSVSSRTNRRAISPAYRAGGVSGKRRVRYLQLQGGFGRRVPRTSCLSRTTTGSSCAPSPALSPTACRAGRMRPVSCWSALVGGALALVAGFLLVQTMRQRRKLLSESAHVTSIVNSSLALFQRFAVIDLVD